MIPAVVVTFDVEHRCSWPTGHVVVVSDEGVSVGRGDDNDLVVSDARVSRREARFVVDNGALRVEHTGVSALRKNGADVYGGEVVVDGDQFSFGHAVVSVVDASAVRVASIGNGWFIDPRLRRPLSGPVFSTSTGTLRQGWLVRGPPELRFEHAFDLRRPRGNGSNDEHGNVRNGSNDEHGNVRNDDDERAVIDPRPRWLPPLIERWHGDEVGLPHADRGLACLVFDVPEFVDAHQLIARAGRVDDDVAIRLALDLARALRHRHERTIEADGASLGVTFKGRTVAVPRPPQGTRAARSDDATPRPVLRLLRRAAPLRHVDLRALQARAEAPTGDGRAGSLGAVVEQLQRAARDVGVASDDDLAVIAGGFFDTERRRARQRDEELALVDIATVAALAAGAP